MKTDKEAVLYNGSPVATLENPNGGRAQISIDDHCYVLSLLNENKDGEFYQYTPYIFQEALEVIRTLPDLKGS